MLVVSIIMMGAATVAIGLLPSYAAIGVTAPVLLLACRLLQGFAVGGEWGGAVLMAAEHGEDRHRGFWSSWPQSGVAMGNLLATGVLWVLAFVQKRRHLRGLGLAHPVPAQRRAGARRAVVRLSIEESPVFQEARADLEQQQVAEAHLPILEVLRRYPARC